MSNFDKDSEKILERVEYKEFCIFLVQRTRRPTAEDIAEGYPDVYVSNVLQLRNKYGTQLAEYSSKMMSRMKSYIDKGKFSHEPVSQGDAEVLKLRKIFKKD